MGNKQIADKIFNNHFAITDTEDEFVFKGLHSIFS